MSPRSRLAGRLLAFLMLSACSTAALAQVEAAAGVSATKGNEATAVASVAWLPRVRDLDRATLRADVGGLYVDDRGDVAGRDLADDVVVAYVGLRYERTDNGLTLGAGIGAQAGETDALSGAPQFVTTLGWRWQAFSLLLRHVSNASIDQPNHGETMLLGAWRF
jgi:hypothetical protein